MAHSNQDEAMRARLLDHRDRVQAMLDRIDGGIDCGHLLVDVLAAYRALGILCADLAIAHLREHVAKVDDREARERGREELEQALRAAFQ